MSIKQKHFFKTPDERIPYIKCQISFIRVSLVDNCKSKNEAKKKKKSGIKRNAEKTDKQFKLGICMAG